MNDSLFFHESQHGFLILTLNRPDVLNTLNGAMSASSREALVNAAKNSDIDILVTQRGSRVLVGRSFAQGMTNRSPATTTSGSIGSMLERRTCASDGELANHSSVSVAWC